MDEEVAKEPPDAFAEAVEETSEEDIEKICGEEMRNRLHALCPYFAMFPEGFVAKYVERLTKPGDLIFDPFSGRGTTVLQSLLMDRDAAGIDINPVAFCVSAAKAATPSIDRLIARIDSLEAVFANTSMTSLRDASRRLPEFFRAAFHEETLLQILFLRKRLEWRTGDTDRFVAALCLGILHGEMDRSNRYLSNQMPRTISPKPRYAIQFWKKHALKAEPRQVFDRLREDVALRLQDPPVRRGSVRFGDARGAHWRFRTLREKVRLVITSPPYFDVTNFEEDQWLRLWFLGYAPRPTYRKISKDDRYEVEEQYWRFLREVWSGMRGLMAKDSLLVCRLGATGMDQREITRGFNESLKKAFPKSELLGRPERTDIVNRQTRSFRPGSEGCRFEVDYLVALGKPTSN